MRGRLTQNSIHRGASIRYGAFIGSWAFIRSFTVPHPFSIKRMPASSPGVKKRL